MRRLKRWIMKVLGMWTVSRITAPLPRIYGELQEFIDEKEAQNEDLRAQMNRNCVFVVHASLMMGSLCKALGKEENQWS